MFPTHVLSYETTAKCPNDITKASKCRCYSDTGENQRRFEDLADTGSGNMFKRQSQIRALTAITYSSIARP